MVGFIKVGAVEEITGIKELLGVASGTMIEEFDGEVGSGFTSQPAVGEAVQGAAEL